MKKEPSKEQMELVQEIALKIHNLATKEGEVEICALIPFSLLKVVILVSIHRKSWPMLIILSEFIAELYNEINEVDIPLEELKRFSEDIT